MKFKSLLFIVSLTVSLAVHAQERIALVIGNSNYAESPLKNPVNDARDISKQLKKLKFKVIEIYDADRRSFRKAIRKFGKKLNENSVGLFYYAGHGMQIEGENYLIPVKADIDSEEEVIDEAVSANLVLRKMEKANNGMNIVILDACRNNPFARSFRSGSKGLSRMDGPTGSIIAFSTAPGDVASDGTGTNGLYTEKLLEYLPKPGLSIEQVFKNVRINVRADSENQQIPWESSSLVRDFYFYESRGLKRKQKKDATEELFWKTVLANPTIDMYHLYLDKYPDGAFISIAKLQISKLGGIDNGREELVKAENLYEANDINEAFHWYKKAAAKSNPLAKAALAKLYKRGWGTDVDEVLSRNYGNEAFESVKKMAMSGNIKAEYYLGGMYSYGHGVSIDKKKSFYWYKKAASKGHAMAMSNIGYAFRYGQGVSQDYTKAMKWFKEAADRGYGTGDYNVGVLYDEGIGVNQNYKEAMKWYTKGADRGSSESMNNIGAFYKNGKGVEKDYMQAMRWFKKAADKGNGLSMHNIAEMYRKGQGVEKSNVQALKWHRNAAAKGDTDSMTTVGFFYHNGLSVDRNFSKAMVWYKKAAGKGNNFAINNIGSLYKNGLGVDKDYIQAMHWFKKAADKGNYLAMWNIGDMYKNGKGVANDYRKARRWFEKSCKKGHKDACAEL